jgi:hypothetical protein
MYQRAEIPLLPGHSNFDHLITTPGILAADKTMYIRELDKNPQYQYMFLRARRWGKSTFLQMLADYYDKNKAGRFEDTFGQLDIGKDPTPCRSSLLVLLFDFSPIRVSDRLEESFHGTLNASLRKFLITNARFLGHPNPKDFIVHNDAADSIERVFVSFFPLAPGVKCVVDPALVGIGHISQRNAVRGRG